MGTRREQALELSEELLTDFELNRITRTSWLAKASRLARLLDDQDAIQWLTYEVAGYPKEGLDNASTRAAIRSGRQADKAKDGTLQYWTGSVAQLEASIDAARVQLAAAADADVSISSANPSQYVTPATSNQRERGTLRQYIADLSGLLSRVCGAVFAYVAKKNHALRFGAAAESAFETVRAQVDATVARLVPEGVQMLAAAFENAASDNPEHWANAAATCRRLLKAVADGLQPPGDDVGGRKMGIDQYVNRLVHWVDQHQPSETLGDVTTSELQHFGRRIDAIQDAGSKGTHSGVTKQDAARILTGTYLLVGDILALAPDAVESAVERAASAAVSVEVKAEVTRVTTNDTSADD